MGIQIKLSTLLKIIWYKTGFYIIHPTKHLNQWHLCLEVYRSTLIQHTYLATPPVQLGACKTWSLLCLCKHSLDALVETNFLLRNTWVFSLVIRMYWPQYIDRVWRESPSSFTSFFDILLLNITKINHCRSYKTTWPEEVPIFTCGLRFSFR